MAGGKFDLDDVGAELGGDLRGVTADINGRLPFLAQGGAARVGPYNDGQAGLFGGPRGFFDLFVHWHAMRGTGIDGEPDGGATQPQGVLHRAGEGRERVLLVLQHVVIVDFEDERNVAGKFAGGGFEGAKGRGIGVAAGGDGQFNMIARIVAGRIDGEAAGRAVLEPLVHRQDDHPPGAFEGAVIQKTGEVRQRARVVAAVPTQYFFDS